MRAVVQRVAWGQVEVGAEVVGRIEQGLLVYVGVAVEDGPEQAAWLAEKVANLRVFEDAQDKLNLSVQDVGGAVLVVSNFTLLADARRGRRPSFVAAATAEVAAPLTDAFVDALRAGGCTVATGRFRAHMRIRSEAVGPVNVVIDTPPPPGPAQGIAKPPTGP